MHRFFFRAILSVLIAWYVTGCSSGIPYQDLIVGAGRTDMYLPALSGKEVGVCVNHTSIVADTHLVDSLLSLGFQLTKVYTPEHGFRGTADAGEKIDNTATEQYQIISLYGTNKKPTAEDLDGIDVMIFDIQDVGVRFYTYIGTMHYVMEACA